MNLVVHQSLLDALVAQAVAAHPDECCGILLGQGGAITALATARNVHPRPDRHFEIDPQVLIDAFRGARNGGSDVLGYYHSHPTGLPAPSATDQREAPRDGRVWAIVAGSTVQFWRDEKHGFEPLSYVAVSA